MKPGNGLRCVTFVLWLGFLSAAGFTGSAHAASYASLAIVKPVLTCDQLAHAELKTASGARVAITKATVNDTEKGAYCVVVGTVARGYRFQDSLPIEHWTQRFLMGAFGEASGCTPAMNGEFAVASGGGGGTMGDASSQKLDPQAATWGLTPQARINGAYLNNHMSVLASKAVIKAFYGRDPRYSYMTGCSIGGWQVLQEAQRFPEDFDGYLVGAPPLYQTVHDLGFWHGWEYHINSRADGSVILTPDRLPILHAAALAHCAAVSGVIDDDLQQPTACTFDKSWVQCPAAVTDTSNCLTAEEASVAEQLYLGPNDGKGRYFEPSGFPLGSELQWHLSTPGKPADGEALAPHGVHAFLMPPLSGQDTATIMAQFSFTQQFLDKTRAMEPLFNATNTDLRRFAGRGAKMILWQGAEDTTVQPANSLSYYEGVQKQMGVEETDTFLRFFLLPGVGHCGGGDSANREDLLTPLMSWVETKQAPVMIVAGKPVSQSSGLASPRNPAGPTGQGGPGGPGGPGGGAPFAQPPGPFVYTRPIYAYPSVARYGGMGDKGDASSYFAVRGPAKVPQSFDNASVDMLGPHKQKFYRVEAGTLVVTSKP
ncbi:MAG TPA: tannase/feruloyl esterase family alpha/beta hydrolase [Dyella sp.]|uniref:tannase/feruloyl esterase family alpha/beta hydrolase n=1 Tax=Dyella sp. TaxID=1869338 RepID=UPI002D7730A1|nr:tannase/feruloyl esterase family alpha/beta hydrolase [Dyella sp.]HET6554687.1 tannase/feruloyl esterase family alpha/beta hydrolase [Dyella sp.]